MALNIATDEADRLAHELAGLTGETVDEAVTKALAERLARELAVKSEAAKIMAAAAQLRVNYDTRPVTKAEMDWASGNEG